MSRSLVLLSAVLLALGGMGQAAAAPFTPGTLFGTDGSGGHLLQINPTTGAGTVVGTMGFSPAPALAVNPLTGVMYAGQGGGVPNLYTINPATAAATLVGNTGLGVAAIGGMDFRADGTLFAAVNIVGDGGTGAETLARIDPATGLATVVGPFGVQGMEALAFSPTGVLCGATTVRGSGGPTVWKYRGDRRRPDGIHECFNG